MAKTRRARIDAENGHRRVTRSRLRIIVKEMWGYPTDYLLTPSGTIEYDRGSRKVGCGKAMIPGGHWIPFCDTKIAELENNAMMGASCAVGPISAASTSEDAAGTVGTSREPWLLGTVLAAS